MREAFERWLINDQGYSQIDLARHSGARVYLIPQVHTMWLSWQAALAQAPVVPELERLRKVVELVTPKALDFIRCGIGANYTGEYYERKIAEVLVPLYKALKESKS